MAVCDHNCRQCTCPFAWTEASDRVQNYGCLPSPHDIINMRQKYGKTWACHSDITKPCVGAINFMREKGLDFKVIDVELVNETHNWGMYCEN